MVYHNNVYMKSPAFQFYAAEYLADADVQLMTLEEEGAYIRLLAYCWREGSIPNDDSKLSRLCKGASTTVIGMVKERFEVCGNDPSRLLHGRLEKERTKQKEWSEKSSEGGKKSAANRWGKKSSSKPRVVTECLPNGGNQNVTLHIASSSSNTTPDPLDEGDRQAASKIHALHPPIRRDLGVDAITKRLGEIRRHRKLRGQQWEDFRSRIVLIHSGNCRSPDWRKEGGQYAKGLDNYLAVTKGRYEQEHRGDAEEMLLPRMPVKVEFPSNAKWIPER